MLQFKSSFCELKSVRNLCFLAFLLVLKIVISSLKIVVMPEIQVSFGFLVFLVVGVIFGPFCSIVFGVLSYFLGFMFGGFIFFHVGFLISSVVSALIYGMFLYKFKFSFKRVVFLTILHDVVIHFFLNIIWLSHLFHGGDFIKAFSLRFIKGLIMLPINCLSAFFVILFLKKIVRTFFIV